MNSEEVKYVVGLTGGSGAGKTKIVAGLKERFPQRTITVVTQDNYYKDIEEQPVDDNGVENFDTLQSIDFDQMEKDVEDLLSGKPIRQKIYRYNNHQLPEEWIEVVPTNILLIEGVFAFSKPHLYEKMDLSVYVHLSDRERLKRRIKRDNIERGYDITDVVYRFEHHVMPAHKQYILPYKDKSDLIIDNSGSIEKSVDHLYDEIKSRIDFPI